MNNIKNLWFLIFAAVLAGCGPADSLTPLYTEKDSLFDSVLLGAWTSEDGKTALIFERSGENAYQITEIDNGDDQTVYEGHLVSLQGRRFLDVVRAEARGSTACYGLQTADGFPALLEAAEGVYLELAGGKSASEACLRPSHLLLKVFSDGRTMKLTYLDSDWLKNSIASGDTRIAHKFAGKNGGIIITASTGELQQFVLAHVDDENAFSGSLIVHRAGPYTSPAQ